MEFNPNKFEKKWQTKWNQDGLFRADSESTKPTSFVVDMFPYPSGSSMHVGHSRGYVATDVYSRYKRMEGFNVLHPMGWDAFGLPAEETAIENKEYPAATVERNVQKFKSQLLMLGLGYDWSREINTTDPAYYKHTQRIFLEFFRRGLARNTTAPVNWCPGLGTVLANEDIVDGKSERGGHPVFQQPMRQWVLAITKYADRLVDDLDLLVRWPEKVKNAQRNWIGRSEGHELSFTTTAGISIRTFTTRIETLPGVTFVVVAPEYGDIETLIDSVTNPEEIRSYIARSSQKTEIDRQTAPGKTGIILEGVTATNPITGTEIPVVVADYVLSSYGTGAIMSVPAHDDRDREIAKILGLPSLQVVEDDRLIHAGPLTGATVAEARVVLATQVGAVSQKRYKIRDWVFSRQRFWGEPFPIVWVAGRDNYALISNGAAHGWMPDEAVSYTEGGVEYFAVPVIPEFLSAVALPKVDSYEPTGNIDGPLAGIDAWVHAFINPETGEIRNEAQADTWIPVQRETNTMPQWAGSSWYWLRYMDPHNTEKPFSKASAHQWGPVNVYAGADHAVAHLIYARFWHKVMQDAGMVDFPEPFERLEFLGYILAADGSKISKRKGNSRSPEDVVAEVGADTFRLYEMFIGPFEKATPWSDQGLTGTRRFLERVWRFAERVLDRNVSMSDPKSGPALQRAIQKVGNDIETFRFNTAVSSLMVCMNEISDSDLSIADLKLFLAIVAPFAPHMTEELWFMTGATESIHVSSWPQVDEHALVDETVTLAIQINGKHRTNITVQRNADEAAVREMAERDNQVQRHLAGQTPKKVIYVPGRILNIVT